MSAVLDLYALRQRAPSRVELETADGPLVITWSWTVDRHELEKVRRCARKSKPWKDVLDAVLDVVDCRNASIESPGGSRA